jgi:hypothetical protein
MKTRPSTRVDRVVMAKPRHYFVDPFSRRLEALAGNHDRGSGGSRSSSLGGHPALAQALLAWPTMRRIQASAGRC